eukprot:TRINITY_DN13261_c0_g1_i1.p1 TRINITY_DN13261_c0_g1~~TRINITY_DN13261_c0_g1_i1.p1  ORF type:complete len:382 (+),score=74.46 TRINITY_DN13261_c0_g1_i1:182-1327(+)
MSTSSIESIDITSTPTPTTKRNSTFSDVLRREDFHCQKPGCEERFPTEDLLSMHQQKHEMKLRIGGELTCMDDTPTPTRFLKFIGGNDYQDDHPSPFDPLFKKVTDDNCDNLAMSIAKDRRYLNEMIPNGLQAIPIMESQHDSNISTSSSNTIYGIGTNNEYQTDIPFPRPQLSIDDNLNTQLGYGSEGLPGETLLLQHKHSSSDSLQSDSISTTASASHDMNMSMTDTPIKKKRGRKPILDEDPVEKRKRYLERNRAAATRCRNKKKVWVNGLEKNVSTLMDENNQLKRENIILKSELRKYAPIKDSLSNFVQLRSLNGLDGDPDNHDRLTSYLSTSALNSPSISQASILRTHPNLLLPMTASLNPDLYSGNHLPPTTNQ